MPFLFVAVKTLQYLTYYSSSWTRGRKHQLNCCGDLTWNRTNFWDKCINFSLNPTSWWSNGGESCMGGGEQSSIAGDLCFESLWLSKHSMLVVTATFFFRDEIKPPSVGICPAYSIPQIMEKMLQQFNWNINIISNTVWAAAKKNTKFSQDAANKLVAFLIITSKCLALFLDNWLKWLHF